jgi:hypothetical protein
MKKLLEYLRQRTESFKAEGIFGSVIAILFFLGIAVVLSSPVWLLILGLMFLSRIVD